MTAAQDVHSLVALTQAQLGDRLAALVLFGSCLASPTGLRGVPDLLAILDDGALEPALRQLRYGALTRYLAPRLPPLTLALRAEAGGPTLAKLNLIEAGTAAAELSALRDLYLVGRLSKYSVTVYARSDRERLAVESLAAQARQQVARLVALDLPPDSSLNDAVRACIALSYRAEVRPEGPQKLNALYQSFAAHYDERFSPLLISALAEVGVRFDEGRERFLDARSQQRRANDRAALQRILRRSRLRAVLRWPKQALVYRGWMTYALDKRRRARLLET